MTTFDIAIKYLKEVDLFFWDITKTPEEQPDMHDILRVCYERFEEDKNNIIGNENYRATVFEVATWHMIDLSHGRHSCFLVACQICEKHKDIFNEESYELRGEYPKAMWDEWDKFCESQNPTPIHLVGEMATTIFSVAYDYVFNPEPPRIFEIIRNVFLFPYRAIVSILLTIVWGLSTITVGIPQTNLFFSNLINTSKETRDVLMLTTSILLWIIIILAILKIV